MPEGVELSYVGRPQRASPSEGYPAAHRSEQERIVLTALRAERRRLPPTAMTPEISGDVPEVLFAAWHNAGRSQMAAALLDHFAEGACASARAGSEPADQINPAVVATMAELESTARRSFRCP